MLWQIKNSPNMAAFTELASRAHKQNIVPVIDAALHKQTLTKNNYLQ
jgi:hypothetical protein